MDNAIRWQPIETAPKDGTAVLMVEFESIEGFAFQYVARWDAVREQWDAVNECDPVPYYWVPLPAPPVEDQSHGG